MLIGLEGEVCSRTSNYSKVFMKISNLLPRFEILMERTALKSAILKTT